VGKAGIHIAMDPGLRRYGDEGTPRSEHSTEPPTPQPTIGYALLQHAADPRKGGFERRLVMDDRQANIASARIVPAVGSPRRIAPGQDPDRRIAPQPQGCCLAVADIEPQKEAARRPVKPESAADRRLGDVEFAAVARAV